MSDAIDFPHLPSAANDAEAASDPLQDVLDACAHTLVADPAPAPFLDWLAAQGPRLMPGLADLVADPRGAGNPYRAFGVVVYGGMPLPAHGFRARRMPEPGRNERCLCGSKLKYKQCCKPLVDEIDLGDRNLLRYVLDQFGPAEFARLPSSKVELDDVADTAWAWSEEGDATRAVALLEAWFAPGQSPTARHVVLLDTLVDVLAAIGNARARDDLLARVLEQSDPALRIAALVHRADVEMERGELDTAWATWTTIDAQDHDNPDHAMLEVPLLLERGEFERAASRARHWTRLIEQVIRDEDAGNAFDGVLDFLDDVANDPPGARERSRARVRQDDALGVLERSLVHLPAPRALHAYVEKSAGEGVLDAEPVLAEAERAWAAAWPLPKPRGLQQDDASDEAVMNAWVQAENWFKVLDDHPAAWHSFVVLDDIALLVSTCVDHVEEDPVFVHLYLPLLERAMALVEVNLAALTTVGTLPWDRPPNRPLLRLLEHALICAAENLLFEDADRNTDAWRRLVERLVALNPDDNHGHANDYARLLIAANDLAGVETLYARLAGRAEPSLALTSVYALWRAGREADARARLALHARPLAPLVDVLLERESRGTPRPAIDTLAPAERRAWDYRAGWRVLWESTGALAWLGEAWPGCR